MSETPDIRILVLGASSWLGYELIERLAKDSNIVLAGTVFRSECIISKNVQIFKTDLDEINAKKIINSFHPGVIINFLRGENEIGFAIHQIIIKEAKINGIHYIYASSVLALDGYSGIDLTESLESNSVSPYGIFKSKCEKNII